MLKSVQLLGALPPDPHYRNFEFIAFDRKFLKGWEITDCMWK